MDGNAKVCHDGLVSKEDRERLLAAHPGMAERIANEVAGWPSPPPEAVALWRAIRVECLKRVIAHAQEAPGMP
jgi:hypothetical protein